MLKQTKRSKAVDHDLKEHVKVMVIRSAGNGKGAGESHWRFGCGAFTFQFDRIFAGLCLKGHSRQREPGFCGGVIAEGKLVREPRAGERFKLGGRFDLKKDRSAVEQLRRLSVYGPSRGEGWKCSMEDECTNQREVGGVHLVLPGFALA